MVRELNGAMLALLLAIASPVAAEPETSENAMPIACTLSAFTPEEQKRHSELMATLVPILQSPRELENGYAFPLAATPEQFVAVAEWITLERKCCPFLQFDLEWGAQANTPELRLTGGPGVKEFIAAQWASAKE